MDGLRDEIATTNDQIREMLDIIRQASAGGPTQTVIHKTEGGSLPIAIAIACVVIVLGFIVIENRSFAAMSRSISDNRKEMQDELRDVKAWNEVLRGKVAKIEAQQPQEKK